ncbi:MAG: membrane protein insertion efficiency factor YidD [Proteobacteria bacterium]|nr:membrane protein insertion efficiency factor YidD [Pseudomonadota bacterium]
MKTAVPTILFLFILQITPCLGANPMNAPLSTLPSKKPTKNYETSPVKLLMSGMIGFYSSFISPADGARSPSYPTGSAYGKQVVEKYGFFPGFFLIADRLLHESDVNLGPLIRVYGKDRYFDPVENNTYWWDEDVLANGIK